MCVCGGYHHERASRCQEVYGPCAGPWVWGLGGYWGGLYRVQGSTTQPPREEDLGTAERARKALQGLEWWSLGLDA